MTEKDNHKLKKQVLGLEQEEFNQLFLVNHAMLYHYGKSFSTNEQLIEDTIQELFIYLIEKEINFKHIKNVKAYLITAFRRRILEKKQQGPTKAVIDDPINIHFSAEDLLIENEESSQRHNFLKTHLNNLPWRQKEAIYLKFFNDLSAKEIGDIMGITTQVVSNTVYKAIKKLKEISLKSVIILMVNMVHLLNF